MEKLNSSQLSNLTRSRRLVVTVWPWAASVLSGLLLTLCFPLWDCSWLPRRDCGWLCWIALTPLVCALWFSHNDGKRIWLRKAGLGYCAGLVFFWAAFCWLTTVTALGWFLLAFYMALYFAVWGWFTGMINRQLKITDFRSSRWNLWLAFLCSATWVGLEWVRGWMFTGFGWNGLGVALHDSLLYIQIADLTGVGGLSFLVMFCNLIAVITVRRFMEEIGRSRIRPHLDFSVTMVLLALVFSYGLRTLFTKDESIPLRVAAVQANIPQNEKFDDAFEQKIFETYTGLTETALAWNPELLMWPEAATPRGMFADEVNNRFVMELAAKTGFNFLLGSLDFDDKGDYNVAVLLADQGKDYQVYRKIHLVPFGEFIPFRHSFPLFAWIIGDQVPGDFKAGREFTLLTTRNPSVKIAPLICFEDTDGNLTRRFVLEGAQVLINLTNDGWFLKSQAAEQQLANAVFRAVENRRPLLRTANTGVTCFVDRFGRIAQSLRANDGRPFLAGVLFGKIDIPINPVITFYSKHGEIFSMICTAIFCIYVVVQLRRFR